MTSLTPQSAQEPSIFEDDWSQYVGDNLASDLGTITDFDAIFAPDNDSNSSASWVDTQLYSDVSAPEGIPFDYSSILGPSGSDADASTPAQLDVLGELDAYLGTPSAGPTSCPVDFDFDDNTAPASTMPSFDNTAAASPYTYTSIEDSPVDSYTHFQQHPMLAPPLLQHHQLTRRSVSEPPGAARPVSFALDDAQPPMVFHRQGLYLGRPLKNTDIRGKRKAGGRGSKAYQPYSTKDRATAASSPSGSETGRRGRRGRAALPQAPRSVPMPVSASRVGTPVPYDVSTPVSCGTSASGFADEGMGTPFTRGGTPEGEVGWVRLGAERPGEMSGMVTVSAEELSRMIVAAVENAVKGIEGKREAVEDGDEC